MPSITEADAHQVASALGDLPLAVATAGAWLAETGVSVPEYLHQLERQAPRVLPSASSPTILSRSRRPGTCPWTGYRRLPRPLRGCSACAR